MRDAFISDDGRPFAEPVLVIVALILNVFVGKIWFTTLFGWWLFLAVATNMPGIAYGALLIKLQKLDAYSETAPQLVHYIHSHKSFMLCACYAVFLHCWWQWL